MHGAQPIPQSLLQKLQEIEPDASFTGSLPRVQSSSGVLYFAKQGSVHEQAQYVGEAESLNAIEAAAPGLAPTVLSSGVLDSGLPYSISQYKTLSRLSAKAADILAKRMATELHVKSSPHGFGFRIPTYCGVTRLNNGWFQRWDQCYAAMVGDLVSQLQKKGSHQNLCKKADIIVNNVIPRLLGPLEIKPVILHGDLWSGNAGLDESAGQPIVFDPASYYGHNEVDLSIARIFGGFPDSFFTTYHKYLPKTEPTNQYDLRMDLYELFHYLNHTLMFGGHYADSADRKMNRLISFVADMN
ncbi:Fructosamine/Ketosamine-3-kinase [Crassisporium funariophilum]|nr:Fructosamine/Ketosamine-3-kinase [Crassisporium funariophilum]